MTRKSWPEPIIRAKDGYRVYKGVRYTVYDDGNSAETPYQTDLAAAALDRLQGVRRYLAHDAECDRFDDMSVPCTCGLDALLADLLPPEEP